LFPSWPEFWAARPDKETLPEVAEPAPLEGFLATLRRGAGAPKIRVR
ncbi:MAG TPA: nuclear transport factor 2 family protein, partial [Pseudomonas sp.]